MPDDQDVTPANDAGQPTGPPPGRSPAGATPPPPAAPAPPGQPTAGSARAAATGIGQPADLMSRFLAKLIDGVLLGVVYGVFVTFLVVGVVVGAMAGAGTGGFLADVVGTLLFTAITLGYFVYMESSRGQTVGKMLLKLEVRGPDGQRPTMEEATKRNAYLALGLIGLIPFVGWLLSPLAQLAAAIAIAVTIHGDTTTHRGWHDTFAGGTSVIKVG